MKYESTNTIIKAIAVSIVIILLGGLSALSVQWINGIGISSIYKTITLPILSPPGWVFGPVWTILYIFIGIYIANLSYLKYDKIKLSVLTYFQLFLNLIWTTVFFGYSNYGLASLMIFIMDISVILILVNDHRKIKWILIPYLVWIIFASYLSISVYFLNK